jgi:hypothetical protein
MQLQEDRRNISVEPDRQADEQTKEGKRGTCRQEYRRNISGESDRQADEQTE